MNKSLEYIENCKAIIEKICTDGAESIEKAADLLTETIIDNKRLFLFGTGHSHMLAEELFYRAGGLANVSPILDTDLMLFNGGAKSSHMEKMTGIAKEIFKRYTLTKKDMLIVISASGKNAVPVEMAKTAKESLISSFLKTKVCFLMLGKIC